MFVSYCGFTKKRSDYSQDKRIACIQNKLLRAHPRAGQWCPRALISAPRRERQVDLSAFKASLVYRMSSRAARDTHTKKYLSQRGGGRKNTSQTWQEQSVQNITETTGFCEKA